MPPFGNLYDPDFRRSPVIDKNGKLSTAEVRRIGGSGFGATLDTTYQYTSNVVGSGTYSLATGVLTINTATNANSSSEVITKYKNRAEYGKSNNFRTLSRFRQTGAANNVTGIRIYVDANTEFGFRLNGAASSTNFEVYYKRAGLITPIANGSFNGNGTQSNLTLDTILGTVWDPTVFHTFEIKYSYSYCLFMIDNKAVHVLTPTNQLLLTSIVGNMSFYSVNSGGGTTNCAIDVAALGGFQMGGAPNNPLYYNCSATAETRTLKAGGGTLHAVVFGAKGSNGNALTIYDNTAGSGTAIIVVDLANVSVGSTMNFNSYGVNFYTGLTYVSTGTTASFTFLWE